MAKDLNDLVTRYGYDELGRLSEVQIMLRNGAVPSPDEITHYGYDAVGNLDWVQLPNGNYTDYTYNPLNRLTEQVNYQNGLGSTVLSSYTYKVYADGQRSESVQTQGIDSMTCQWRYDNLNRLTQEIWVDWCTNARVYDLVGNVKTYTTDQSGTPVTTNYLYNAKDQLLTETAGGSTITYGYDDNGSLTSKATSGGTETYVYDLCGKLKTFTPAAGLATTYTYDPEGNRVGKSTAGIDTDYVFDTMNPTGYSQVLAETTGIYRTYYTIGLDMIGQSVNAASPQYFVYDGHGSTRQLTNATGALVQSQEFWYDAYGNELGGNAPQTNLLYCGEQHDTESGLYYLRTRMYNPQNGRFTSIDLFEGNNDDPISLHKYLYCSADPINNIDPLGLFTAEIGRAVHNAIQDVYADDLRARGRNDFVRYGRWTRVGTKAITAYRLKPDIFNMTKLTWLEIKPLSQAGVADGVAAYDNYLAQFKPFYYSPEASWIPPKFSVNVGQIEYYFFNAGGIIFYTDVDIKEDLDKLMKLGTAAAVAKYFRTVARQQFANSIVNSGCQIQKLVRVRTVADRERLNTHLKIAAMFMLMGFL